MKHSSETLGAGVFYRGHLAVIKEKEEEEEKYEVRSRVEVGSNTSSVAL
jgi:hypothetical protein